jgi:hypothetical protein
MITVISLFEKQTDPSGVYINTTSKSPTQWTTELSPFYLGPCDLYGGYVAKNMENGWQFSKVYACHIDADGDPTDDYFKWAEKGWSDSFAHRYPMGKGAIPQYSYWNGKHYSYIDARKHIYAPLYARAVAKTKAYAKLKELVDAGKSVYLLDYDAYRHRELNMTLTDVLNYPKKKMGHAFVLMMLLTNDDALNQCKI